MDANEYRFRCRTMDREWKGSTSLVLDMIGACSRTENADKKDHHAERCRNFRIHESSKVSAIAGLRLDRHHLSVIADASSLDGIAE